MRQNIAQTLGNNFGAMRLLFASLVILSHSPEMIDGNRSREILTSIFGTLSFGEVAVDAFFLVSGYLISQSYERSRTTWSYLRKRIGRIIPGYFVCFVLSLFVVGYIAGGNPFERSAIISNLKEIAVLGGPTLPDVFSGLPYPVLNGSLWSISYEFRCYLLVVVFGFMGLLNGRLRFVTLATALTLLFLNGTGLAKSHHIPFERILGSFEFNVRLVGIFLSGMLFNIFRERITFSKRGVAISCLALTVCMFSKYMAEPAFAIFGGYLIFSAAFLMRPLKLSVRAEKDDISYGMYLYAWPVQMCLIWFGIQSPWLVCILTFPTVFVLAALSWKLVEEPFKKLSHRSNFAATEVSVSAP